MHDSCNCTLMTLSNYGHRRELCAGLHVGSTTLQIALIKRLHLYKGGGGQHAFNMFRQISFNVKVFLPCRIESHRPVLLNHVRTRALAMSLRSYTQSTKHEAVHKVCSVTQSPVWINRVGESQRGSAGKMLQINLLWLGCASGLNQTWRANTGVLTARVGQLF